MLGLARTPSGAMIVNASGYDAAGAIPPIPISAYSVLSVPAYYRAITFLSANLASFPRTVRRDGTRAKSGEDAHPLARLLGRRPNGYQNGTQLWRTLFFHACHTGNGYVEIERPDGRTPGALHNLLPEDVTPFRYRPEGGRTVEQWYFLHPGNRAIPAADVIHLQTVGYDGMGGTNPIALHGGTFQRASTIDRYQTRYLSRGTVLRGSIEFAKPVPSDKKQEIRAYLRGNFQGDTAEQDILLLDDGATFKNVTTTPRDSQLLEHAVYSTKQIAQITGVPPQFLYEFAESKYNNSIEQMGQDVVRYTFRPWVEQAEDELTVKLLSEADQRSGYSVNLDPDALLRGDTKAVAGVAVATTAGGVTTRNEARATLGLPPDADPESDKLKTLGDSTPPGGASAAATPPPPAENPAAN